MEGATVALRGGCGRVVTGVPIVNRDSRPVPGQFERHRAADPLGGSRNGDDLACQSFHAPLLTARRNPAVYGITIALGAVPAHGAARVSRARLSMHKYIMIGPQGSGKGTQSQLLADEFGFVHISIGEIFRWNVANHTKLGSRVTRITQEGRLVSDEVVERVVRERLELHDWRYGFVLDGFPRTPSQAMYLFENWNLDRAIYLDLDDKTVRARVSSRAKAGEGSGFTKRADDNPEALRRRLDEYHEKTRPLLDLFAERDMLLRVDAGHGIQEVYRNVVRGLGLTAKGAVQPPRLAASHGF